VWVVVVAAGRGIRYGGDTPKQYQRLAGRRVLDWSVTAARQVADGIVLVVAEDQVDQPEPTCDVVVAGGIERSDSVRAGLAAVPDDAEIVVVHDAARPLASPDLFSAVVAAVREGADGAIPGLAPIDTIKRVDDSGVVEETLVRDELRAVQTPQAFRAAALRDAHRDTAHATDDAALVEARGGRVVVVDGEPLNIKITHQSDVALAERHLAAR
jgi:2-C-methyl-D-erythritol 4-phosphate cytidylyltransferase